ncbi:hypothetical protein RBH29_03650 [Herbivorax sp. ANBcel31]|uniref:hypothetical protein n=1 Tax=Herbivorax sp. ANBcel31 TaxID=3069754 RepID=UPI0027B56970|nr:hypothetical protein [Herbivorax sp. ANBcel31]MDQ2085527.1 hypothetical protein [Herbivorax sp. ANBcel31]
MAYYNKNIQHLKIKSWNSKKSISTYDELNRVVSKNVGNISGEALYKYDILVFDGNDYLTTMFITNMQMLQH